MARWKSPDGRIVNFPASANHLRPLGWVPVDSPPTKRNPLKVEIPIEAAEADEVIESSQTRKKKKKRRSE